MYDSSKFGGEFKILFSQVLYWNSFTSSNNIIINGENSTVIICSVCGDLQDHNLQIDLRSVDIYTIPRSCYNHSEQQEFVVFILCSLQNLCHKNETEKI